MLSSLHPVHDIRLSGHVIYTGRSSMEVAVKMEALGSDGSERTVMLGMSFFQFIIEMIAHDSSHAQGASLWYAEMQRRTKLGPSTR